MKNATLVTGASGFLGRRVCDRLISEGIPVIATGRDARRLPLLPPDQGVAMVAELSDELALRHACAGADTVIHCAALSSPWGRSKDFIEANFEGTRRLLEASRSTGVRRFIHVSSSSVVFDGRDATQVDERTPYASSWLSHYQRTKAAAEGLVHATHGLETVILRPRAIFGPGDTALLPRLLNAGRAGWLRVIGTGRNMQDLTHVDNVVDALLLARTSQAAVGHTYFISNDEPVPLWDLIFEVFDALGVKRPTRQVSKGEAMAFGAVLEAAHCVGLLSGEPRLTRYTAAILAAEQTLDISAARRDLGYAPRINMRAAVAETIDSLRPPSPGGRRCREAADEGAPELQPDPVQVDLHLGIAGSCRHPEFMVLTGGSLKPVTFPALFATIDHPIHGLTLFDTGYSHHFLDETRGFPARLYRWLTPPHLPDGESAVEQLARRGIAARDVRRIICSHFHADHVSGLRDFPNAELIAARVAVDAVRGGGIFGSLRRGFLPGLLPDDFDARARLLELGDFDRHVGDFAAIDLFDDGSTLLVYLPGHAAGQLGLLARTPQGRKFLVADAAWTTRSIVELRRPHRATGLITDDADAAFSTLVSLHALSKTDRTLELIPSHDPFSPGRRWPEAG